MLEIRVLGGLDARAGGVPVELPPVARVRSLLAFLAVSPGPHPRSLLAGRLRPDALEESARKSLRQAAWSLRGALGPAAGALLAAFVHPQHALYWIGGGLTLAGGLLVLAWVHEVKRAVSGPWRLDWLGSLKTLLAVRGIGPLIFLGFLFSVMWHGSITNITVFMLQLLEGRGVDAAGEAWWIGAAAMGSALCMLVATPVWGRVLDRAGPAKVLMVCGIGTVVTHAPLLVLQTPMELVLARAAFGLSSAGMQAAIVYLLRNVAPPGMDARAIAYMSAFQFFGMGLAPFLAGLIGPVMGMRAYFALTMVLMAAGLWLWRRPSPVPSP